MQLGLKPGSLIRELVLSPPCSVASALMGLVYGSFGFEFWFDQQKLHTEATQKEIYSCATANHFYHIELRIMCSCKNYDWNDLNMREDVLCQEFRL